jgi:hypothetical protein
MSVDWTSLWGDVGELIGKLNGYRPIASTTLAADLLALTTQFGTRWASAEGVAAEYQGFQSGVVGWRRRLAQYADRRVQDQDTVQAELGLQSAALQAVLEAVDRQMRAEGESVKANTVTVGAVAAPSYPANRGDGWAFVTDILDGATPPSRGMPAWRYYDGLRTELCVASETVTLECTAGSGDGVSAGGESWRVDGEADHGELDWRAEGSGQGPSFRTADSAGLIAGGSLSSVSGTAPSGWTLELGNSSTCAADAAVPFGASPSLKVSGEALFYQALPASALTGRRRYFVGVSLRAASALPGATVRLGVRGDDYSFSPALTVAGASLTPSWQHFGGWVTTPPSIPAGFQLAFRLEGTSSAQPVWAANARFAPAVYHGGVGLAVVAGESPWARGDRLAFTLANDDAGKFQTFARQHWRRQLPSVHPGDIAPALLAALWGLPQTVAPTVTDSWAS